MKIKEFNLAYEKAKEVDVVTNDWFCYMTWFWMNLTNKQLHKMYDLMLTQGAEEKVEKDSKYIILKSGLMIKR